jgi:gas vesicle protein
MELNETLVKVD